MKRSADAEDTPGTAEEAERRRSTKKRKKEKHRSRPEEAAVSTESDVTRDAPATPQRPNEHSSEAVGAADDVIAYPYEVDDADHCESPLEAYKDISFFLEEIAKILNKTKSELRIYDPYFCEGSMVKRLGELGFTNVYNRKEDFYAVIAAKQTPEFDVLVTNPPYSGDNVDKLMNFSLSSGKPFFLLMPNYVYQKDYYLGLRSKYPAIFPSSMFYVSPKSRYLYTTPKGRRQQKSAKFTSPFPSFWYCSLGHALASKRERLISSSLQQVGSGVLTGFNVAPSAGSLPLDVLADNDPRKKKYKNALKRKKHKARKKQD